MPHNLRVPDAVDSARRRAQLIVAAEAAAAGAAVAAASLVAGAIVAAVAAIWGSRRVSRRAVVRKLERADPQQRNIITTASELETGRLAAKPSIRDRVDADAAQILAGIDIARVFPLTRIAAFTAVAVAAWTVSALVPRIERRQAANRTSIDQGAPAAPSVPLRITVRVESPRYTHLQNTVVVDPVQIDAIERADVQLSITAAADVVTVDDTGSVRTLQRTVDGTFEYRLRAIRSGYLLVAANDARRMITLTVKPDALPTVILAAPGRDLVYEQGNPKITFQARASDDFGLQSLMLRYTKVSGSGEQFAFSEGEIPLAIVRGSDRQWEGTASRTLSQLALAEGDMLVYRAVAADMRPGAVEASSDAFYIEVSKLGIAAGDAFTLPEQETKYALSQQMLIVKTERLQRQAGSMARADLEEAAQALAVEQRMIRSEFVFMLGGEVADEEVEAEQSVEIQAGRLANRGQRDIRAATIAMSQAEKLLTAADTAAALKAERAAVEALQRAFARDRYILRALASRTQLDLNRRLTGAETGLPAWHRALANPAANRVAIALQSLLQGLGEAASQRDVEVLSAFVARADPESAELRRIAADLQKLADAWPVTASRPQQIQAIAAEVIALARRVAADPPMAVGDRR